MPATIAYTLAPPGISVAAGEPADLAARSMEKSAKMDAVTPPSACSSVERAPSTVTSIETGGSTPGTEHDASRTLRKSSTRPGRSLDAIAPMSQTTSRLLSRLVVPT